MALEVQLALALLNDLGPDLLGGPAREGGQAPVIPQDVDPVDRFLATSASAMIRCASRQLAMGTGSSRRAADLDSPYFATM